MPETLSDDYGLSKAEEARSIPAPLLPYHPRQPRSSHPIGLVGCGGISAQHLNAYRHAGYQVIALCDRNEAKARARRDEYFPQAAICTDYRELLALDEIEILDVTTHPADRPAIIESAIEARKHVLSQKPFVEDLEAGERLADLAERQGVLLAVNQNGRWAPHFSFMREAVAAGLIGDVVSVDFSLHWDHGWIIGTPFEKIEHLILYDFGIHWFDLAAQFFKGRKARSVTATSVRGRNQRAAVPMLAGAMIEFDEGLASLSFNAAVEHGQEDRTYVAGTRGTMMSRGPSLSEQRVRLATGEGIAEPELEGTWFREGFHGAMAELMAAIEDGREPVHSARDNLRTLELVFAAVASSRDGAPKRPGEARRLG